MAITGENFCGSAKKIFFLNLRNIAKVTVTHGVTHAVLFFGKVFSVGLSVLCCFFIITSSGAFETTVEPLFPCLLCAIVAFLVASNCCRDYPEELVTFLRGSGSDLEQVGHFLGEAFSLSKILRLEFFL